MMATTTTMLVTPMLNHPTMFFLINVLGIVVVIIIIRRRETILLRRWWRPRKTPITIGLPRIVRPLIISTATSVSVRYKIKCKTPGKASPFHSSATSGSYSCSAHPHFLGVEKAASFHPVLWTIDHIFHTLRYYLPSFYTGTKALVYSYSFYLTSKFFWSYSMLKCTWTENRWVCSSNYHEDSKNVNINYYCLISIWCRCAVSTKNYWHLFVVYLHLVILFLIFLYMNMTK